MIIFIIFTLPLFPILYGYVTKNKISSILIGVIPFLMIALSMLTYGRAFEDLKVYDIFYWFIPTIIIGLEGYFAAKRNLLCVIGLYILLIWIFLSGLH
jgi:hypothetical protein